MAALHHIGEVIPTVASLYPGEPPSASSDSIRAAVVETDLSQLGGAEPVISISLRQWHTGRFQLEERLALALPDANELANVLRHLIDVASGVATLGRP